MALSAIKMKRRSFLKLAAATGGAVALSKYFKFGDAELFEPVAAQEGGEKIELIKTICIHCSVGCGILAKVANGQLVGIEPWVNHPINRGRLCSKGASIPASINNDRRLKYPMKKEGGKWRKISWEEALTEIANKMKEIREKYGPDAVFFAGSAHVSNEAAYLQRKFMAFWGSNNIDHQARICHSTTVAGLGNTWGYGAQTNNFNDMRHAKSIIFFSNPAEAHPVSFYHIYKAKQRGAVLICCDPRFSRTAAQSDLHLQFRPGTDIPLVWGICHEIITNGWVDEEFIRLRTHGYEYAKEVIMQYPPEVAEEITGVPAEKIRLAAKLLAENRPGTLQYAMGATQHEVGTHNIRAFAILQLMLGNAAKSGGGVNAFRGHDNVQGATDLGVLSNTLPSYYGLSEGAWKHWAKVWGVSFEWLQGRFASKELMHAKGATMSRWRDLVLAEETGEKLGQPTPIKMAIFWGHSMPSQAGTYFVKRALEKLEMLVIVDPYVESAAALPERDDGIILLPACTNWEYPGTVTNSSRQVQWRNKVIDPLYDSKPDVEILIALAEKLGFGEEFTKNFKKLPEDIYDKEIRVGARAIAMRQSTWRLKRQQEYDYVFNIETLRAEGGPCDGEYWGLPWPCWNDEHPGTPILYRNDIPVAEGGHDFRAKWGTKAPDGKTLLSGIDGHPELNPDGTPGPGWKLDLTTDYKKLIAENKVPYGRGRARFWAWNLPDPVPVHREPVWTPRPELARKYPTFEDKVYGETHFRIETKGRSIQERDILEKKIYEAYPLVFTSGRQVEHQGGGAITRANPILVELQPEMYVEINPRDANDRGIKDGDIVWVHTYRGYELGHYRSRIQVKAKVTRRVPPGVVFLPFHWAGMFETVEYTKRFPEGTAPIVIGECANTIAPPGWAPETQMQTTKSGLCEVTRAGVVPEAIEKLARAQEE